MSNEEVVEGEEGEDKKEEEPAETKPPSIVQIKLAEQGKYVAAQFDRLFAITAKIEAGERTTQADLVAVSESVKAGDAALQQDFHTRLALLSTRVLTIEKERAAEKAAAEAARRAALGLPPEERDPFEKFNKIHTDLGELVRSNPTLVDQAVLKLEETLSILGPSAGSPAPSSKEASPPPEEEA